MADDETPGAAAAPDPVQIQAETEPIKLTAIDKIEAARDMLERGWSPAQVKMWLTGAKSINGRPLPEKTWKVSHRAARTYLDRALEGIDDENVAPQHRKQARVRATLTLLARRALDLACDPKLEARAAGLINAGVAALDKIARIDGSYTYDPVAAAPAATNPASPEEAARLIAHAQAMLDLARRRGALAAPVAAPPTVIDAESVEVDGEPDDEASPDESN